MENNLTSFNQQTSTPDQSQYLTKTIAQPAQPTASGPNFITLLKKMTLIGVGAVVLFLIGLGGYIGYSWWTESNRPPVIQGHNPATQEPTQTPGVTLPVSTESFGNKSFYYLKTDAFNVPGVLVHASNTGEVLDQTPLQINDFSVAPLISVATQTGRVVYALSTGANYDLNNMVLWIKDPLLEPKQLTRFKPISFPQSKSATKN